MRIPAVALAAVVALSGCALFVSEQEAAIPDHIVVDGSDPLLIQGWAYDGENVTAGEGSLTIDVVNSTANGTVEGTVNAADTTVEFSFEGFAGAEGKPSHANGINQDFPEHGDSGNGHNKIPKLHAVTSGWGPAKVTVDGTPVHDPVTGQPTVAGHFMVTDTGIRHDGSREIRTRGGGIYSPSDAGNGQSYEGDNEVHLVFKSTGSYPDDRSVNQSGMLTPAAPNANVSLPVKAAATKLVVQVQISSAQGAPTPAQVNATLRTPNNDTLRAADLGGTGQTNNVTWNVSGVATPGTYQVVLNGQGGANWDVQAQLKAPKKLFLHFLFETASWRAGS